MSGTTTTPILVPEILEVEGFMSPEELECLAYIASKVTVGRCVLEIGTFRGLSTLAMACGSCAGSSVPIYTVDPHGGFTGPLGAQYGPMDRVKFFENMAKFPGFAQLVRPICLTSEEAHLSWLDSKREIDLLLIDGNHNEAGKDRILWEEYLSPGAAVIFDDCEYPAVDKAIGKCLESRFPMYIDKGVVGKLQILEFRIM